MKSHYNIVIVGAGFAGLSTYFKLAKQEQNILLINDTDHFLFTPLLPDLVAGELGKEAVTVPLGKVINKDQLKIAKVINIDLDQKEILLDSDEIVVYERLLLASGSQANYYNIPGASEFATTFRTLDDVERIQSRTTNSTGHSIAIVGGGAVGVELAFALRQLAPKSEITIVEVTDQILPGFAIKQQKYCKKKLEEVNIKILTNSAVSSVGVSSIKLRNGQSISATQIIWAAGARANTDFLQGKNFAHQGRRLPVDNQLRIRDYPEVFVGGDSAGLLIAEQTLTPMHAQVAVQQAHILAKNIRIGNTGKLRGYKHSPYGQIILLGRWDAVASVYGITLTGFWAALLAKMVYFYRAVDGAQRWRLLNNWARVSRATSQSK